MGLHLRVLILQSLHRPADDLAGNLQALGCISKTVSSLDQLLERVTMEPFDVLILDESQDSDALSHLIRKIRIERAPRRVYRLASAIDASGPVPGPLGDSLDGVIARQQDASEWAALLAPVYQEIPVSDPSVLKQLSNSSKRPILEKLFAIMSTELPNQINKLRAAAQQGDATAVSSIAHRIRSDSEALGFLRVARTAECLERTAPVDASGLSALCEEVCTQSAIALEELHLQMSSGTHGSTTSTT